LASGQQLQTSYSIHPGHPGATTGNALDGNAAGPILFDIESARRNQGRLHRILPTSSGRMAFKRSWRQTYFDGWRRPSRLTRRLSTLTSSLAAEVDSRRPLIGPLSPRSDHPRNGQSGGRDERCERHGLGCVRHTDRGHSARGHVKRTIAVIAIAGVGVIPSGHVSKIASATSPDASHTGTDMDVAAQEFAEAMSIPVAEAQLAFAETGPIGDFNDRYRDDPRFGAIWVSYADGYRVHLRVTGRSPNAMAAEIEELQGSIVGEVLVSTGGASAAQLRAFAEVANRDGLPVLFDLDHPAGRVDVYRGTDRSRLPKTFPSEFLVFLDESPELQTPATGLAGSDSRHFIFGGWYATCTAGFMWGGFGITGYAIAGHCPDATVSNPSSIDAPFDTTTTFSEFCPGSGGDYQAHSFITPTDPKEHVMNKQGWGSPISIEAVAGGYYIGQTVFKTGLWANSTSTSWGVVNGFGSVNTSAGGDCAAGTASMLKTTALGKPGDSGGPVLLLFANAWYAAGMTSSTNSSNYVSAQWLGWINVAAWGPSAHWCVRSNPCGVYD
jgi:hypothetical protein